MSDGSKDVLKTAFEALTTARQRIQALEGRAREPIAIISMACRFPGADDPEALWRLLEEGRDEVGAIPADRWDSDAIYDPDPEVSGKCYVREGGFLKNVYDFDPAFFGISPGEAISMDPQQRLVLETAWEALERVGMVPEALHQTPTGVYIGMYESAYSGGVNLEQIDSYTGTGAALSVASGRLSYTLGLHGPAMTVETACSSSLVSVHLACQALRAGECDLALAGGATVLATPFMFVWACRARGMSPSGRCKSFSDDADGLGWGEGAGMLVLKRLSDAQRDGDRVLALVRGGAINHDGRSQGLTAPNGPSQRKVLRRALEVSGLSPHDIDYVETHGTGTPLGDPIEAGALAATFGPGRPQARPLYLGSLKSNIGHTGAAAGVGGIMKVVLSLQHERLPRTLHSDRPNHRIDWATSGMALVQDARPWPAGSRPRRAGVSSFGVSGTNAHLILEEAPRAEVAAAEEPVPEIVSPARPLLFALSARSESALRRQAERLASRVEGESDSSLAAIACSLATTRTRFDQRAAVVATDARDLVAGLRAIATGQESPSIARGTAKVSGKLAFVFPGGGSPWAGMGQMLHSLLERSDVFRRSMERCGTALSPHVSWSLAEVVSDDPDALDVDQVDVMLPVVFSVMVSLAEVWRSYGIEPDAVIGHSQGEIAAACVSGALTLEEGARIIASRGLLGRRLMGRGAAVAIEQSADQVEARLSRWGGRLSVAAVNSSRSVVVSGDPPAVDELLAELQEQQVFARKLRMNTVAHNQQMDSLRGDMLAALRDVRGRPGRIPLYSTVEARPIDGSQIDAEYLYRNIREPVRFADAVRRLVADGFRAFVELSAHPVLKGPIETTIEEHGVAGVAVGSLRRNEDCERQLASSLGQLYVAGVDLDWQRVLPVTRAVSLPTYAFDRHRFAPSGGQVAAVTGGLSATDHPLIRARVDTIASEGCVFLATLSRRSPRWLKDHEVFGHCIVSGTTILELCRAALAAASTDVQLEVADLTLLAPLVLLAHGSTRVQIEVSPAAAGARRVEVYGRPVDDDEHDETKWQLCATASGEPEAPRAPAIPPRAPSEDSAELVDDEFYQRLASHDVVYGSTFRCLESARRIGPDEVVAHIRLPADLEDDAPGYGVHPALLDAAFHAAIALDEVDRTGTDPVVHLPFSFGRWSLWRQGDSELRVRLQRTRDSATDHGRLDLELWDREGRAVGQLTGVETRPVDRASLQRTAAATIGDLFEISWDAVESVTAPRLAKPWTLVADDGDREASAIAEAMRSAGAEVELVTVGSPPPVDAERVVRVWPPGDAGDVPGASHALAAQGLAELQARLSSGSRRAETVWITRQAMPSWPGDVASPPCHATLWGLGRTARSEHPELGLRLLDLPGGSLDVRVVAAAVGSRHEPELILRSGRLFAPRLVRAVVTDDPQEVAPVPTDGAILITGGLGELGHLAALWLAKRGVPHLLLISRRGSAAAERSALAEIEALGATAQVVACDVSDPAALARAVASLPVGVRLRGVVHCAGFVDDDLVESQTPEGFRRVMMPKVWGAWNLHQLSLAHPVEMFVLYSSVAGVIGSPGQSNYAAANVFLDSLAHHRRAIGLPAVSLAWGVWRGKAAAQVADLDRMARQGFDALTPERGMGLFECALSRAQAVQIPWALRLGRVSRWIASEGVVPALWRNLVRPRRDTRRDTGSQLRDELRTLPAEARRDRLLMIVRDQIAHILGRASGDDISVDLTIQQLGLDSLMAVQLRNALAARCNRGFPATAIFQHPTPEALSSYLLELLDIDGATDGAQQAPDRDLSAPPHPDRSPSSHRGFAEDAALGPDFRVGTTRSDISDPRAVLLTGATGFLGAFLLAKLLRDTTATIHCLVRGVDPRAARARLDDVLHQYQLPIAGYGDRVHVWAGDLGRPRLGLEAAQWDELADSIDVVYHAGALVNFAFLYSDLKPANVDGTREVLSLAARHGVPVHHFSTIGVFPPSEPGRLVRYAEEDVPLPSLLMGYATSKWVAEQVVREAGRRGLPVTIYRIGEVIGHSRTGVCRLEADLFGLVLKAIRKLRATSDRFKGAGAIVPVDYVVDAIAYLARQQWSSGRTFHLFRGDGEAPDEILMAGAGTELLPFAEWQNRFSQRLGTTQPFSTVLPLIERYFALWDGVRIQADATRRALEAAGIRLPPTAASLAATIGYLERTGFFADRDDHRISHETRAAEEHGAAKG